MRPGYAGSAAWLVIITGPLIITGASSDYGNRWLGDRLEAVQREPQAQLH